MNRTTQTELILNDAARAAVKAFRNAKPWRGSEAERVEKFANLHAGMIRAYDMETMLLRDGERVDPNGSSVRSYFDPRKNHIVQLGRLSVVTYFVLFAMARGCSGESAVKFAHRTFKHFFPRSYAGCRLVNGFLVRS